MSEKILKGRLVQKHDVAKNWAKATSFIPKQGEVIIYDKDETFNYERIKIGDGETRVNALPFIDDALRAEILAKINTEVGVKVGEVETLLNEHVADETLHITSEERNAWNASEENAKAYTDEQIGSHVHSWNDLEDKPFGEETGEIFICEEEEIYIGETGFNWSVSGEPLVIGQEYTVAINGQEYTSIVKEDANGVICCGNTTLFRGEDFSPSGEDTGEPFVFANRWSSDKKFECFFAETLSDSITFAISTVRETVNCLNEKYIPDTIARAKHTHSWNDLEDRPFGEEKNYIWSGTYADMESLETRIIDGHECVRVSDFSTVEDLNQAEYIMYENGKPLKKSQTLDLDDFDFESDYVKCSNDGIYVVSDSYEDNGITIPYGLWIRKDEWYFVGELYRLIFNVLDEQYISDAIARKTDVEPALSLATEAIISNTETLALHTEQIAALQTEVATIVEITVEEVDALFAGLTE